ncbi:hypothetical protein HW532_15755 [Kaustia mangrovi]|uniref:Nucleotide-diphospho-sugar transferase domain-containing protein n=1 Tax=Kaustia mangrovi TaxID=2593653 RepID=A0A7S8C621_9HYPH|nr:hypothetical protein [Kaustia mangrovi]QPC44017.1 hypothetical protein HW532_15755 [Kaustia mangrovi]
MMFHAFGGVEGGAFDNARVRARHEQKVRDRIAGGGDQTHQMISMATRSISQTYPEADIVLLTDRVSNDIRLPDRTRVEQIHVDMNQLMLSRVRQYRDSVERAPDDGYMVFIDTDMLLFRRFDEILKDDFNLAFTIRRKRRVPINVGFYVANLSAKGRVMDFFDRYVGAFEALDPAAYAWEGEQPVLARMLGAPALDVDRPRYADWGDIVIKYLPTHVYNFTPDGSMLRWRLFSPRAKVLHLKGSRKYSMPDYYRRYIEPKIWGRLRRG